MKWETAWKKSVKLREEYERLWSEVSRREKKSWYDKKPEKWSEQTRQDVKRMQTLREEHARLLGVPYDNTGWGFGFDLNIENLAAFIRKVMSYE